MRITDIQTQTQFLNSVETLQSNISQTENELSSGLSFTTASQNPTAAGEVDNYNQALAQNAQYTSNAQSAQSRLNTESSTLTQVQTQVQSLRDLALEANNATLTAADRQAIATQAVQIQDSLVALANTQDGNGEYLFGGFDTSTQPFTLSSTGATYNGDQGQRQVQIAPGQTIPDGDSGSAVFEQIKDGNGTFTTTPAAADPTATPPTTGNTGTGVVGATTVSDPATYAAGDGQYTIDFTTPSTYKVLDSTNATVTSGTYTSGDTIAFAGVQVTLTGAPAAGDSFAVAPSTDQSLFTTVQNLVTALQGGGSGTLANAQLSNSIGSALGNIDQALAQISNVQSGVGGRLDSITTQLSVEASQKVQLQTNISNLQGLDYASALTVLDQQNTTLAAALQSYSDTQGLSLFKYIQ